MWHRQEAEETFCHHCLSREHKLKVQPSKIIRNHKCTRVWHRDCSFLQKPRGEAFKIKHEQQMYVLYRAYAQEMTRQLGDLDHGTSPMCSFLTLSISRRHARWELRVFRARSETYSSFLFPQKSFWFAHTGNWTKPCTTAHMPVQAKWLIYIKLAPHTRYSAYLSHRQCLNMGS